MQTKRVALVNRNFDFWCLGGLGIMIAIVVAAASHNQEEIFPQFIMAQIAPVFGFLAIIFSWPHFMSSYKLAYERGFQFVLSHWFCLLFVPIALMGFFVYGYAYASEIGLTVLAWGGLVNNLTVGWHYSKQSFGCSMVYAHYDNYPLTQLQRNIFKYSLISIALHDVLMTVFLVLPPPFPLPQIQQYVLPVSLSLFVIMALACFYFVIWTNYKLNKLPSVNFVLPWVALFVWWNPFYYNYALHSWIVPFFHGLQYMPFVYMMARPDDREPVPFWSKLLLQAGGLIAVGYFFFIFIGPFLDGNSVTKTAIPYFGGAVFLFINIHHFFIDHVIWRFNQPEMRARIL